MNDWKIFVGDGSRHDGLKQLPDPPPWRFGGRVSPIGEPGGFNLDSEKGRAAAFLPTPGMIQAVNAALYLRRPLLLTGKPGSGKSTLISKVSDELMLGPVLRWPINSRSSVRGGVYEYDAVGRLQSGKGAEPPVEDYLVLGPLGTALAAETRPRALLIDEIDKSDLDFANDLLNVIEEGEYDIPEILRLKREVEIRDFFGNSVITDGRLRSRQFPFVVMTSNAEREFPAPFLRRCIRLTVEQPEIAKLAEIVDMQLKRYSANMDSKAVDDLIRKFISIRTEKEVSTDQLLNAVYLTIAMRSGEQARHFNDSELASLQESLLRQLSGAGS